MAVTAGTERVGRLDRFAGFVFDRVDAVTLAVAALAVTVWLHGYNTTVLPETMELVRDPFSAHSDVGPWRYQSPTGFLTAWMVGADTDAAVAAVHLAFVAAFVIGGAVLVRSKHSDEAARLFVLAYFCSPQSWAGVAVPGLFDVIVIGSATIVMFGGAPLAFAAAVLLGFHHFEQGVFVLVSVTVIRVMLGRHGWLALGAMWVGLLAGKVVLLTTYLWPNDLPTNGRAEFLRNEGVRMMVAGWRGHELALIWAVFNVLWVGMIWMWLEQSRRDQMITVGLFCFSTLPVLITFDLSRVYRNVTWPLVLLLVMYAAEHHDRVLVRRAAVVLTGAALFVPRSEYWRMGLVLNG